MFWDGWAWRACDACCIFIRVVCLCGRGDFFRARTRAIYVLKQKYQGDRHIYPTVAHLSTGIRQLRANSVGILRITRIRSPRSRKIENQIKPISIQRFLFPVQKHVKIIYHSPGSTSHHIIVPLSKYVASSNIQCSSTSKTRQYNHD